MTLTTMLAQCRVFLQDSAGTYWDDPKLTQWLNEAQMDFAVRTKILPAVAVPVVSAITPTSAFYTLPTDAFELRRVELSGVELARVTSEELSLFYDGDWTAVTTTSPATIPTHSYVYEEYGALTFRIFPYATASQASSLKCFYYRTPATLVATSAETPDIPAAYHIRLVDFAVARAYLMDFDQANPVKAKVFMDAYDAQVAALTPGVPNAA